MSNMMFTPLLCLMVAVTASVGYEVLISNPPPEQAEDSAFTMVPSDDYNMYLVNVDDCMNEQLPPYDLHTGVIFELYTPSNPTERQILYTNNTRSLANSNFDASRPTRFVVHGWNTNGGVTTSFQNAYFVNGQHNVNLIAVNWQAGSNTINYPGARRRVNRVGPYVAAFVDFLVRSGGVDLKDVNLIGHSLGGHIVGIAGKHVSVGKLPLIVALDPANPLFSMNRPLERVAVGDAENVHVIHTAAGSLGFSSPIGDASFYPNGGRSQPGCGWDMTGACAHSRAIDLYAESINYIFYSLKCASYREVRRGRCNANSKQVRMGQYNNARGIFFLETHERTPFALGKQLA